MATATPVKFGGGTRNRGTFHVEKFNMFDADDQERYSELRTKADDASSGIEIELIKEYSCKEVVREGSGDGMTVTTSDHIYLLVHYWEKKPKALKGEQSEKL